LPLPAPISEPSTPFLGTKMKQLLADTDTASRNQRRTP